MQSGISWGGEWGGEFGGLEQLEGAARAGKPGPPDMPEQLPLLPASDLEIRLRCPGCGYGWLAAIVVPGAWWAGGVTPASIARICYCPKCDASPPMVVNG